MACVVWCNDLLVGLLWARFSQPATPQLLICTLLPPDYARPSHALQQPKVEMEAHLARALPPDHRCGCTIVFRRGSPLDSAALDLVSISTAGSIVISGVPLAGGSQKLACCAVHALCCMRLAHPARRCKE